MLGGTGKEGGGLALRWANAGYPILIGSRSAERAQEAASKIAARLGPSANVRGTTNINAASRAEIVLVSVPYAAQRDTIDEVAGALEGKILVDVTVPLAPPKVGRVQLPVGGSAVEAIQTRLGPQVRVVSAFQNISAHHLEKLGEPVDCDVLVCSDDPAAADRVVALSADIGLTAWNAGPLANSAVAEALTSVLITLNRRYKAPGSGIRITGIPRPSAPAAE